MITKSKFIKFVFYISILPAIIGFFFSVKYFGWVSFKIGAMVSIVIPGFLWGITKPPEQNAILYTYHKDNKKLFGRGELISTQPMVNNKTLIETQKEHKEYIRKMGREKRVLISFFLIPYCICLMFFFILLGWITFLKKAF